MPSELMKEREKLFDKVETQLLDIGKHMKNLADFQGESLDLEEEEKRFDLVKETKSLKNWKVSM